MFRSVGKIQRATFIGLSFGAKSAQTPPLSCQYLMDAPRLAMHSIERIQNSPHTPSPVAEGTNRKEDLQYIIAVYEYIYTIFHMSHGFFH